MPVVRIGGAGRAAPRSRISETSESLSPQEAFVFRSVVGVAVRRWFGASGYDRAGSGTTARIQV